MKQYTLKSVSFRYELNEANTLENIDFEIEKGSFVTVCGPTGCGKSTLLRLMKEELCPAGTLQGEILFTGKRNGFVMQNVSEQCVTERVYTELAFGLENLGVAEDVIRRKIAEISAFFGIEGWFEKEIAQLSGGQKQILNLAAVMMMDPEALLLDEPTSQLDPIATGNFLTMLEKVNRELGVTVILAEHNLEEVLPISDEVLALRDGKLSFFGTKEDYVKKVREIQPENRPMLPAASELYIALSDFTGEVPFSVRDARRFLSRKGYEKRPESELRMKEDRKTSTSRDENTKEEILRINNLWFCYDAYGEDVLKGLNLSVKKGEILGILGSNGCGKTTLLKLITGLLKPGKGKIKSGSEIAFLPQEVESLFIYDHVDKELEAVHENGGEAKEFLTRVGARKHPYDLSGGEKQQLAMLKVLAGNKQLLLLDEPTRGLDPNAKEDLRRKLLELKEKGITILLVTHDIAFVADTADRCGMLFRGEMLGPEEMRTFLKSNRFYTTQAARIAEGFWEDVLSVRELLERCRA